MTPLLLDYCSNAIAQKEIDMPRKTLKKDGRAVSEGPHSLHHRRRLFLTPASRSTRTADEQNKILRKFVDARRGDEQSVGGNRAKAAARHVL
jgi:hypothetical protein